MIRAACDADRIRPAGTAVAVHRASSFLRQHAGMTQPTQPPRLDRTPKAQARTRRYAEAQTPLPTYILQGAAGMLFMMFIFWLAGFGS